MAKADVDVDAIRSFMTCGRRCRSALFAATSRRVGKEQIDGADVVPDAKVTETSSQVKDEELRSGFGI